MSTNNRNSAIQKALEMLSGAYRSAMKAHAHSDTDAERAQTSDAIDNIAMTIEGLGGALPDLDDTQGH